MPDNWPHEETDDPLYADRRNFYFVEKWQGLFRPTPLLDAYAGRALNMILKELLDISTERTPILFGKLFQLGF